MRLSLAFLLTAPLSACVTTPGSEAEPNPDLDAIFAADQSDPADLPPLDPPTRLQSRIQAMSTAELARWILPTEAQRITASEMSPGRFGIMWGGGLWTAPRPAGPPGICEVNGWSVAFRIPNENTISQQQRLDPPLEPHSLTPQRLFKVAGSTMAGGAPNCAVPGPYSAWTAAPSADALHLAARLVEQAQLKSHGSAALGFRLDCTGWEWSERRNDVVRPPCRDARGLLQRLSPDLIKRVGRTQCEGFIILGAEGQCIGLDYRDPEAPESSFLYLVRIRGTARPRTIEIQKSMMPPH